MSVRALVISAIELFGARANIIGLHMRAILHEMIMNKCLFSGITVSTAIFMIESGKTETITTISNGSAALTVDLFGGAFVNFKLHDHDLNPLSFRYSVDQMPKNNRAGAPYRGHFLCLPRWGEPSPGEIAAGLPNHGQFANIMWSLKSQSSGTLDMTADADLELMRIDRTISFARTGACCVVKENIQNTNRFGRMYHMVQHPTIAAPFLDNEVIVQCNATDGFAIGAEHNTIRWHSLESLRDVQKPVYSFIVDPGSTIGWVTAYSPSANLLFGYVWLRADYPWINHWIHEQNGDVIYRGLEFGTTGVHRPFTDIAERGLYELHGERTFSYLDAGASRERSYVMFLMKTEPGFAGTETIEIDKADIVLRSQAQQKMIVAEAINFLK